ncbi:protein transport protein Sec24C [Salarias fasciatus]|uniref:protein transport protein Sec24C n=1 Tax=Salarias fasciatus TaxID=181472 RepID=UPI001177050A|nr:protein transport protein Sec24C-like [Salarias fasciatus]
MMDVPSSNQRQAWAGQNGWSTTSPPAALCSPLPTFHRLSVGSPSHHTPCYSQQQASHHDFHKDCTTFSNTNDSHQDFLHTADQSMQQMTPSPQVSSMIQAAGTGKSIPPCSLPHVNGGTQLFDPQQTSFYSPHIPYQVVSPPLQAPSTRQVILNGPQSLHQNHLLYSPPLFGQHVNQSPLGTSQTPSEGANIKSPLGYSSNHSSPIEQQPQWTLSPHSGGTMKEFGLNAAAQERNITPQSPNSESRYGLDPELLPSAVKVMAEDRAEWEGKVFISEPFSRLPPLATTSCVVEDRGNASPFAIRSTSYCVPCEGQTALLSRLPLGALVTPMAHQLAGEKSIPLCTEADCVEGCASCGASMCPAMSWQDCGQRFYCPFCGKLSEVKWQHYQPTKGAEGVRVDRDKRPELSLGSYEILRSQRGEPAALLLAIDVSISALRGGHLEFITQQIQTLLNSLHRESGELSADIRVGLLTYDSRIHLYDLSPDLSRPHMLVIAEKDDLQLPLREGLLVSIKDCAGIIDSVLQLLPQLCADSDDSSGVPMELPVKAGLAVLQGLGCPGKLLIFHTASLIESEHTNSSSGFFGTNKPKSIFQPSEATISLAKECVRQGCGVHLFVLSQQDVGGAWPGHIPYLTGGALHAYSHLQGEMDRERFISDLRRTVETDTGYNAELRIFVSKDLRVSACYGLFVPGPSPRHVTLATLDRWTTLAVELAHTRPLDETRGVAIQVAMSYVSESGDRRTRIHTLTLRCSRHLQDTFRHCQAQTLLTFYCKKMYCAALERPLQELREELQTDITEALASYRKHGCSASVSAGQLVLPQHLRALPIYMNSLRKSEVLLPGLRSSVHQRLQQRCQVLGMDACGTATHFYPLLQPLVSAVTEDGSDTPQQGEALRCSSASLDPTGLYLVQSPLTVLLWVGTQVPACTLMELFNTGCFSSLPSGETKLPVLQTPVSVRVRSLINMLDSQTRCTRKLWVVKQGDTCEEALQRHLVEDKSPNGGASYADFLYHLHINSVRLLQ